MTGPVRKTASNTATARVAPLFYSSAREGMADLLSAAGVGRDSVVLLPDFIGFSTREGSGVHDPVAASGAQVKFYPVEHDLSPDADAIANLLSQENVKVLVVIHYFGRTARHLQNLREMTLERGVLLVEDLAHGFFTAVGGGAAGRTGDAQLYSLHKMFPRADGGMLQIRDEALARKCRSTRPELAEFVLSYDWCEISRLRRRNFSEAIRLLQLSNEYGSTFDLPWTELNAEDVPQTLPVRVLNGTRDAVYQLMNESGFGVVSLYHTLVHGVQQEPSTAMALSQRITNLPVHQDVSFDSIEPMIRRFVEVIGAASRMGRTGSATPQ